MARRGRRALVDRRRSRRAASTRPARRGWSRARDAVGPLAPAVADALGLPRRIVVAAGGGDAAVGAVGIGAIAAGRRVHLARHRLADDRRFRRATAPRRKSSSTASPMRCRGAGIAMAAMLNGAGALAFVARLVGADAGALEREAAEGYSGPGETIVPALSLRRTDAARRPARARRRLRPRRSGHARRSDSGGDGGGRVDPRRGARSVSPRPATRRNAST